MVNDLFIDTIQLNDNGITARVSNRSISKRYNNFVNSFYRQNEVDMFPISGSLEEYDIEFTLIKQQGYHDLLDKEHEILTRLGELIEVQSPVLLESTEIPLYLNSKVIQILITDGTYTSKATDGKNFLVLTFNGIVYNNNLSSLGETTVFGIASMMTGGAMTGEY